MDNSTSKATIANVANPRAARLLNDPVLATLLGLAAPDIVLMLAQAGANFLESYYVSRPRAYGQRKRGGKSHTGEQRWIAVPSWAAWLPQAQ
jgi:hypothetical protein